MKTTVLTLVILASTPIAFQAVAQEDALNIKTISEAVNYSGKTRMLSMRMAMLYAAQISSNISEADKAKAAKSLTEAQVLMETIYTALASYGEIAAKPVVVATVAEGKKRWDRMARLLIKDADQNTLLDILSNSEKVLAANEKMTAAIAGLSTGAKAKAINIAGRQRMYSMRLGRDYLAASIGVDRDNRVDMMLDTAMNFEGAMLELEVVDVNTAEINGMINSISKMEWKRVYAMVTECVESNNTKFRDPIMFKFVNTLLVKANKLTGMYVVATSQ